MSSHHHKFRIRTVWKHICPESYCPEADSIKFTPIWVIRQSGVVCSRQLEECIPASILHVVTSVHIWGVHEKEVTYCNSHGVRLRLIRCAVEIVFHAHSVKQSLSSTPQKSVKLFFLISVGVLFRLKCTRCVNGIESREPRESADTGSDLSDWYHTQRDIRKIPDQVCIFSHNLRSDIQWDYENLTAIFHQKIFWRIFISKFMVSHGVQIVL